MLPAHGILTISPYSVLGRNGDADDYVPRGCARMYADVVGTGNSGGCYDYGGLREKETAHDVVEWVTAQPWSRGRVGKAPRTTGVRLSSTPDLGLTTAAATPAEGPAVPFSVVGSESAAMGDLSAGVHGDRVVLLSAPLTRDVRMFGAPVIRVGLDTRYATGLTAAKPCDGSGISAGFAAHPTDWTFRKGHRIALLVQTSSTEWTLPKAYDGVPTPTYGLTLGPATSVTLPLVGAGDVRTLFSAG